MNYILSGVFGILAIACFFMLFGDGNRLLAFIFFAGFSFGTYYFHKKQKNIEEEESRCKQELTYNGLKQLPNFRSTQQYASHDNNATLAIDEESKQICFFTIDRTPRVYKYREILKSEILTDGYSVSSTNRGSQIGGALLGGILAGGVGAIIGGLSGSQTSEEKIKKMELNVIVNDTKQPIHKLTFMESITALSKNSEEYKRAFDTANHCHQLMSVLIRQADDEDKQNEKNTVQQSQANVNTQHHVSVADELRKLAQLKDEGLINQEEFELQKNKLIG